MREQLEKEGRIVGPEKQINILKSAGYTTAEKGRAKNYFEGDQVIFNRERNGVEQGDVLSVVVSNPGTNTIAMLRENGKTVIYKPDGQRAAQAVDILRSDPLGIRQGDLIRFTRNDDNLGLINLGTAEIKEIEKKGNVTLMKEDGGKLTLEGDATAIRFRPCLGLHRSRFPGPRGRQHPAPCPEVSASGPDLQAEQEFDK